MTLGATSNVTPAARARIRRLDAIVVKESLQIVRDPSTLLVAFVLPVVMLFLFAYAVSLDIRSVPIGVALESDAQSAQDLAAQFAGSRYFSVVPARDRRELAPEVIGGRLRGFVVIPADFERRLRMRDGNPLVQIVTDGSQPNTAAFVANYAQGVVNGWLADRNMGSEGPRITLVPRFWFNPEIESRRALIPGALAIIMTMIGTLLTALVVAREWERGTMEGLLSTPIGIGDLLVGKLLPYFVLGLAATLVGTTIAITLFGVPLRGSWFALLVATAAFLVPALGQGLLISAVSKNQFVAAQMALLTAFLPSLLLSGFLFEIASMPQMIQLLTYAVPARYFNTSLQTIFLAGDVWPLLIEQLGAMLLIGLVFFGVARFKTRKSLEA
jgi:ABC-2 type transport system permease protein